MNSVKLHSYAKINLTLKILGLRPDGFHELESVMQNVSLHDGLSIKEMDRGIELSCGDPRVPTDQKNICYKATRLIQERSGINKGVLIEISKSIPMEAGMGGGSSNGAAVLVGLNKMWGLGLNDAELMKLASELGSDVPFFIVGGTAMCRGRGDIVESRKLKVESYIIIKPDVSVPTKWAYDEYDIKVRKSEGPNVRNGSQNSEPITQSEGSTPSALPLFSSSALSCFNDLEDVVIARFPEIAKAKQDLLDAGCSYSQMTGSGSAVFGISGDQGIGDREMERLKAKYRSVFSVGSAGKGVEIV